MEYPYCECKNAAQIYKKARTVPYSPVHSPVHSTVHSRVQGAGKGGGRWGWERAEREGG